MGLLKRFIVNVYSKANMKLMYSRNNIINGWVFRLYNTESKSNRSKTLRLGLISATLGVAIGTGYSIHKLNDTHSHIASEITTIPVIANIPHHEPSKRVINTGNHNLKLVLYQYQTCPFCCKVRAFLDYYGISYDIIEVDPVLRQSIKWSEYKKVPILLAKVENGYQQFNDSSMIISALSTYLYDKSQSLKQVVDSYPLWTYINDDGKKSQDIMNKYFIMYNENNQHRKKDDILEEQKWRKWADQVLVHLLSPNVYRTPQEALQAFNWFSDVGEWEKHFPTWERMLIVYVGATAMWMIGKRLKRRHNLKDDVRISLYDECNKWVKEIKKKKTVFMGGDKPNLADLAVFGVLSSIEGCDAFKDLLTNSNISVWYYNMKKNIETHNGNINELFVKNM